MSLQSEILLESGTNEVEIAKFMLGDQYFGVNVAKIREFIPFAEEELTHVVDTHPSVLGVIMLRGKTIPLIDLNLHLKRSEDAVNRKKVIVITEFNNTVNGFLADKISQIHRLSWEDIKPLDTFLGEQTPYFTGTVTIDEENVLLLDLEFIISEIFPGKMDILTKYPQTAQIKPVERRGTKKLLLAEDSMMMSKLITSAIVSSGYVNVVPFENGQLAFEEMQKVNAEVRLSNKKIGDFYDLIITDIEMPQMDGLTFCKKIKEELKMKELPVVIFSSLINEQMAQKCDSVGADAYISKPEVGHLVELIDSLLKIHE